MLRKIKNQDELRLIIEELKAAGKKVVFTNGCFDIIHTGHTRYLDIAKKYGDVLVVAVNSDESVKKIKGDKRPILPQAEDAEAQAAARSEKLKAWGSQRRKALSKMKELPPFDWDGFRKDRV